VRPRLLAALLLCITGLAQAEVITIDAVAPAAALALLAHATIGGRAAAIVPFGLVWAISAGVCCATRHGQSVGGRMSNW